MLLSVCGGYDGAMSTLLEGLNSFGMGANSLRRKKNLYTMQEQLDSDYSFIKLLLMDLSYS